MKGLPGIGQQAVASSPLKAVIMIARTSGYTVPGLCSPSFVFVELHGVISTDSGGGEVIFTYILPQDESSPHNMKLTDHHMFTPFPP